MRLMRNSVLIVAFLAVAVMLLEPDTGESIPAFARKYGFSCSTCHTVTPKLKDYGDDFAGNGFQLPDDDEPVRAFQDVGDDDLLLQRDFPLAVRFDAYGMYTTEGDINGDFQTPYGLKLMSGGNIAKDIGYYFYFYMDEHGEVAGVEDAYIHFNNIMDSELDIMVGQFQISDPLFKRELRLTYEDYMIYKTKVGDSPADLTYDRGVLMTYALPTNTDFVLQVVNGNGIGDMGNDDFLDIDAGKNVFFKVNQGISMVSLGAFGYTGTDDGVNGDNTFTMVGPEIGVGNDYFQFDAQYITRSDDNPDLLASEPADDYVTEGTIGRLFVNPFPDEAKWFGVALYNKVTSDYAGLEYETATLNVSYLWRTNLRVLAEVTQDLENEETRFILGTMTGF